MWRGLVISASLCHAQNQIPFGDDEHALLQARALPRSPSAKAATPSMLETVRNLARTAKQESPETVTALVASITATLQDMKPLLQTEHEASQSQLDAQFTEIGACGDSSSHGTGAVAELANQVAALEACDAARAAATTARDGTCGAWSTHAGTTHNAQPGCLSESATPAEILANMQALQTFLEDALPGMNARNVACNDANANLDDEDSRCEAVDTEFDGAFCDHQRSCAYLHSCNDHEAAVYDALYADSATAMTARQDQYRTIAQVECLLGFITTAMQGNSTVSEADMGTCDGEEPVDSLVLSVQTPGSLSACPAATAEDPECPAFTLPPLWTNGEADDAEVTHVGQLSIGGGLAAPPDMPWRLALNIDTNDGNVLNYANAAFWESEDMLGGASSDESSALMQDYKNLAVFNSAQVEQVLIVVHDEGEMLGWRRWRTTGDHSSLKDYFNAANTCAQGFHHSNSVHLAAETIDAETGQLDRHEPMVFNSGSSVDHLWVNAGDGDDNRLSTTNAPRGNYGWGLGTAYDVGGSVCAVTMRPQADAQLRADYHHWGSSGGIGGLLGTDHICGSDNGSDNGGGPASCPQGRCGQCPWTVPSNLNYDYAIFVYSSETLD